MPAHLNSLAARIFVDCGELNEITLPSNLISVSLNAFEYFPKLKYVNHCVNSVIYKIQYDCDDYASFAKAGLIEIDSMTLVDGVQLSDHEREWVKSL